jgi:DNA-directed RNA polymerase subunit RPC12/RpoP
MASQVIACECGRKLRVDERLAGKTVRCPACGRTFVAPEPPEEELPVVEPAYDVQPLEEERPRPRKKRRPRPSRLRRFFISLSSSLQDDKSPRYLFLLIAFGVALLVYAFLEGRLIGAAADKPQTLTLARLAAHGPGDNAHVIVTDFVPGNNFVYEERTLHGVPTGNWTAVYVPVVPLTPDVQRRLAGGPTAKLDIPPGSIRVIVHSSRVHSQAELSTVFDRPFIQGTVVNSIRSLPRKTQELLQGAYPGTAFDSCWILQEGRKPSSAGLVIGAAILGTLLVVVGGLMFAARYLFRNQT